MGEEEEQRRWARLLFMQLVGSDEVLARVLEHCTLESSRRWKSQSISRVIRELTLNLSSTSR